MDKQFIPLLFAGDINVYGVAWAFNEEYGIKPHVYGKFNGWPCYESEIMHYKSNPKADQQETFLKLVVEFANENADRKILLIGCGDSYVELISINKANFPENVITPYISIELMEGLIHKEKFYELCEKTGVDYPSTFVHKQEMGMNYELPFEAPFIIKPSSGIKYWQHPFENQKKVYKANSRKELDNILKSIYDSGYDDSIIIQDFIPGDDTFMWVLTNYSDQNGKVKMMCLGHVLLEEHTPHGLGNHAVIITERKTVVEEQFKKFLEELNYVGFSNFDIKFDSRDGKFKVFEINTRQGRSNSYVTSAGMNIIKYVVEDCVYGKELEFKVVDNEFLWMVVPKGVAFQNIKPDEYKKQMKRLIREGKYKNPLYNPNDRKLKRRIQLFKNQLGHYYKFKKYSL